MLLRRGGRL